MPDSGSAQDALHEEPFPPSLLDIGVYYKFLLQIELIERHFLVEWADAIVMQMAKLPNWIIAISLSNQLKLKDLLAMIHEEAEQRHIETGFQLLCCSLLVTKPCVAILDEPFLNRLCSLHNYFVDEHIEHLIVTCAPCSPGCKYCWEHIQRAYSELLNLGKPWLKHIVPGPTVEPVQFRHYLG